MKRFIVLTLSIVLAFSLCACGQDTAPATEPNQEISSTTASAPNVTPTESNPPAPTETTPPPTPTAAELETLQTYQGIVEWLYNNNDNTNQKDVYDELMALDTTVIDKWRNTEYTSAEIEWDYKKVLSNFIVHENVLLGYKSAFTDILGNVFNDDDDFTYNQDRALTYSLPMLNRHTSYGRCQNCHSYAIVDGQLSFYVNSLQLYIPSYSEQSVDENGRIKQIKVYDSASKTVITWLYNLTYNADGNLAAIEMISTTRTMDITFSYNELGQLEEACWQNRDRSNAEAYDRVIWYEYSDDGKLARSFVADFPKEFFDDTSKIPYTNHFTDTYYEYDSNGHLCKLSLSDVRFDKQFLFFQPDVYDVTCDDTGRILNMSIAKDDGTYKYDFIYGDYYIFNPPESE